MDLAKSVERKRLFNNNEISIMQIYSPSSLIELRGNGKTR